MDFLDTVTGGIDDAVGAVLAPVADTAGAAASVLRRELTQTWHGVFGSPTMPGGTNWNAYSHEEMYAMVKSGADPGQVGEQAAVLDGLGRGASEAADDLTSRRGQVPEAWEGQASNAFGSTLGEHSAGGAAVAEHAAALSAAVLRASEALSRAQSAMPEPVDVGTATTYGAVSGAAGPNFALGAVTGAGASWFAATLLAANKKAEAVEVMQAFEQSLQAADPPESPAKLPPGVPGGVPLPAPRPAAPSVAAVAIPRPATPNVRPAGRSTASPVHSAAVGPASAPPVTPDPGPAGPGPVTHSAATSGTGTTAAAAPSLATPAAATTSAATTSAATTSASAAGPVPGAAASGAAVGGLGRAPGWVSGPDGRASGRPMTWPELVGRGGVHGLLANSEPRAARATAVPANGRREEDREHHNRMPRGDNLFTLDDKTPPPVIGA